MPTTNFYRTMYTFKHADNAVSIFKGDPIWVEGPDGPELAGWEQNCRHRSFSGQFDAHGLREQMRQNAERPSFYQAVHVIQGEVTIAFEPTPAYIEMERVCRPDLADEMARTRTASMTFRAGTLDAFFGEPIDILSIVEGLLPYMVNGEFVVIY